MDFIAYSLFKKINNFDLLSDIGLFCSKVFKNNHIVVLLNCYNLMNNKNFKKAFLELNTLNVDLLDEPLKDDYYFIYITCSFNSGLYDLCISFYETHGIKFDVNQSICLKYLAAKIHTHSLDLKFLNSINCKSINTKKDLKFILDIVKNIYLYEHDSNFINDKNLLNSTITLIKNTNNALISSALCMLGGVFFSDFIIYQYLYINSNLSLDLLYSFKFKRSYLTNFNNSKEKSLLIIFSHDVDTYTFLNKELSIDCLFLSQKSFLSWYLVGIDNLTFKINNFILKYNYRKVYLLGSSKGAFGALNCAKILLEKFSLLEKSITLDLILFSPIVDLSCNDVDFPSAVKLRFMSRYYSFINKYFEIYHLAVSDSFKNNININIMFGSRNSRDTKQIDILRRHTLKLNFFPIDTDSHNVMPFFPLLDKNQQLSEKTIEKYYQYYLKDKSQPLLSLIDFRHALCKNFSKISDVYPFLREDEVDFNLCTNIH
ncbi:hypothetical protein QUV58_03825 [Succinatimonas hippei]|uniref:hypothetical protein n=1 Tax=Succinatimonas hippei TaxID=626938 RepID=UPI0025A4CC1F|nr:hypothetical protein [Succinatimonas hippei]MDM8119939.1 hypothetical protein [Succinatimonas hippei]